MEIIMMILGLADSHDSGVTLVKDGKIIFAINQERLDRIKLSSGFPIDCLNFIENNLNINLRDIDIIAIAGEYGPFIQPHTTLNILQTDQNSSKERSLISKTQGFLSPIYRSKIGTFGIKSSLKFFFKDRRNKLIDMLKNKNFGGEIIFLDHHLCHATSAIFSCPLEIFHKKSLIVTADGAGDGLSGTVYISQDGKLKKIHEINQFNSLALLYSYVTEICGFTPMKHEGKITGLAAFGRPIYYNVFRKMVIYKNGSFYNILGLQHQAALNFIKKEIGENFNKADLAASIQIYIENEFIKFINYWIKKTGIKDLLLAGGIFANVKLNQRINELPFVNSVFIHQNMGDGGISFGAALFSSFQKTGKHIPPEKNVYFGQEYSDKEIEEALRKYKIVPRKTRNIEKDIALLLASGKVIARFNGRMEYGPRALGNRSILYQTTNKTVNDWLNKRLHRCYDNQTEILTKDGWKYMKDISDGEIVATLNPMENKLEFQQIKNKLSYGHEGEMFEIKNNRIDLLVTPNHNMWVKRKHSNKFNFMKVDDVVKIKTYHYEKKGGINWVGKEEEYFTLGDKKIGMDYWLEFLGYYLSEGSFYYDSYGHYRISIGQSKNSKYYKDIDECLQKTGFNYWYSIKEFIINNKLLYTYLKNFGKAKDKHVPREILELSKRQLKILFDALMKGDGNLRGGGYRYATTSKRLADDMQELALKLGFSSYVSKQKLSKNPKHNQLYMVRIGKSSVTTIKANQIKKINYKGEVYCVEVPNHLLFVRRNGRSVFCGNTEFMPFAPVTLIEEADKCYKNIKGAEYVARFMTITFNCTDFMKKKSPAVVHVDSTARPQLIDKDTNPSYRKILEEYYNITGIPSLINTSFNMHEEPIVCTPEDAIRSFLQGSIDYLAIGNFLVKNQTIKNQ